MITVRAKVQLRRVGQGKRLVPLPMGPAPLPGRVPRISRLVALAIRFDRLLREGKFTDLSELARLARVTQPRMTQIMNLTLLAPDILEQLLHLPLVTRGRDRIHEKMLRPIVAVSSWQEQRRRWDAVRSAYLADMSPARN